MSESRLIVGDCREVMATLPAQSVHCVATSPPYWGLRDYGIQPVEWADGTTAVLGLEDTPEAFIAHLVEVFQCVRRILRDDGVAFVNLGDSYDDGDLLNMPHRVAAALQADGWCWRSTIVWHKKSPMPESLNGWRWMPCRVKVVPGAIPKWSHADKFDAKPHGKGSPMFPESIAQWQPCPGCPKCSPHNGYVLRRSRWRPTCAHEYIFMFTGPGAYFCDAQAVAETAIGGTPGNLDMGKYEGYVRNDSMQRRQVGKANGSLSLAVESRNPRSVLTLSSEPYPGLHFATFPSELPRFCIQAATSAVGCCPDCGAPYAPVVSSERVPTRPAIDNKIWKHEGADGLTQRSQQSPNLDPQRHVAVTRTLDHWPTCSCNAGEPEPCTVFDPFAGSGTTLQVARAMGRRWIGAEVNPEYAIQAEERIPTTPRCMRAKGAKPVPKVDKRQKSLEF